MELSALTIWAKVKADTSDVKKGVADADKELSNVGKGASSGGVDSFLSKITGSMTSAGVAMSAAITVPIVAASAALLKLADTFDAVFDDLRVNTGATGDELKGLQDSVNRIVQDVPASFEDAGKAVSALRQKLGETGPEADNVAKSILELSRITHTDLKENLAGATALFQRWNVELKDQVPTLDKLFVIYQKTGVPIGRLQEQLKTFQPILKGMGLGLNESAALLAKLDQSGANTDKAMAALSKSFGNLAKTSKDPAADIGKIFDLIKNAKTDADATGAAVAAFGGKVGVEMAGLVRSGKLDIADFFKELGGSHETIMGAAKDTEDFGEAFTKMKNKALVALQPLALKLLELADKVVNDLQPAFNSLVGYITQAVDWFTNLPEPIQGVVAAVTAVAAAIGPVLVIGGQLIGWIGTAIEAFGGAGAATGVLGTAIEALTGPIGIAIAAGVALVVAYKTNFAGIGDAVDGLVADLLPVLKDLWEGIKQIATAFEFVWEAVKPIVSGLLSYIGHQFSAILDVIRAVLKALHGDWTGAWEMLKSAGQKAAEGLRDLIGGIMRGLVTLLAGVWQLIVAGAEAAWAGIKSFFASTIPNLVTAIVDWFMALPGRLIDLLKAAAVGMAREFGAGLRFLIDSVPAAIESIVGFFANLPQRLGQFAIDAWEFIKSSFSSGGQSVQSGASRFVAGVIEFFADLPNKLIDIFNRIVDYLGTLPGLLWNKAKELGASIWHGFLEGLDVHSPSGPEKATSSATKGVEAILKGAKEGHKKAGKDAGDAIKGGFAAGLAGMDAEVNKVVGLLSTTPDKVEKAVLPGVKKVAKGIKDAFKEILDTVNDFLKFKGLEKLDDKEFLELDKAYRDKLIKLSGVYKQFAAELKKVTETTSTETKLIISITQADLDKLSAKVKKAVTDVGGFFRILPPIIKEIPQAMVDMANKNDPALKKFQDDATAAFLKVTGGADGMQARLNKLGEEAPKPFAAASVAILSAAQHIEQALAMDEGLQVAQAQLKIQSSIQSTIGTFEQLGQQADKTGTDLVKFVYERMATLPPEVQKQAAAILKNWSDNVNQLPGSLDKVVNKLLDSWGKFDGVFRAKVKGTIGGVIEVIDNLPGPIGAKLKGIADQFLSWVDRIDNILHGLHKIFDAIPDGLGEALGKLKDIFKKSSRVVIDTTDTMAKKAKDAANGVAKATGDMGKSATEGGSTISKGFGIALAAVEGFVTGLSTASATGSKAMGALVGGLTGALSGLKFGPWGALIGGAAGILGGLLGGKSAAQKEQERLQLEQQRLAVEKAKQDIQKGAQEIVQAALETFQKAQETLEKLADYSRLPKTVFQAFFKDLGKLLDNFIELSKKFSGDLFDKAKKFADNMGPVVDVIAKAPLALEAIGKYLGVSDGSIKRFVTDFTNLIEQLGTVFEEVPNRLQKHARKFAERMGPVADLLGNAVDGLIKLFDLKPITDEAFAIFATSLEIVMVKVGDLAGRLDGFAVKQAAKFADRAGAVADLMKSAVDALVALATLQPVPVSAFDVLFNGIQAAITRMSVMSESLSTEGLTKAEAVAQKSLAIFAAIKAGVEALSALRDYKGIAQQAIDDVVNDFKKGLDLLGLLLGEAEQFEQMAIDLEKHLKSGAAHIASGLAAMGAAIVAAASALAGSLGGLETTVTNTGQSFGALSLGQSFGTSSLTPAAASASGGGSGNIYIDNITLDAKNVEDFNSAVKTLKGLEPAIRRKR